MPKKYLTLNDFSGGVNLIKDPRDLKDNELSKAENIMVDKRGAIRTIGGEASQALIDTNTGTAVGGYGLSVLESDYETEPATANAAEAARVTFDGIKGIAYSGTIDSVADLGGAPNEVRITCSATHGMIEGQPVRLDSLGSYTGTHTITNVNGATTFDIESASYGDDSGSYQLRMDTLFPAGTELLITNADTSSDEGFCIVLYTDTNGGIYVDKTVSSDVLTDATITSLPKEDVIVLCADAGSIAVDTYSKNQDTWTADQIDLDTTSGSADNSAKVSYYAIDGAIRACDGEFKNVSKIKWFGQVKRVHFADATAETVYYNWYEKDNDLAAPTACAVGDTYPADDAGFDLLILTPTNTDSTWVAATYQVAISYIYDGNQESLLYAPTGTNTFVVADGDSVTASVHAHINAGYNPRISGGRAYCRIDGSDDPWFLLCDIDMRQGARATLDGTYAAWVDGNTPATDIDSGVVTSLGQNLDTYESLNGFSHEETSITLSQAGEGWKTSCVANRRAFVANVRRYDPATGENKTYSDRIIYSEIGKFDTFPESNYMDVVRGDAENYVKIIEYADRLLAFKQNSVQIINISSPSSSGWFLEDNFKYQGAYHPGAVTKTDYGIAWVNESGCYLYDGQKINNLTRDNLDSSTWSTFIGTASNHISIIGFERFKKQLIIMKDCTTNQADGGDAWIYDFFTRSWVKGLDVFTDSKAYTNFVHDWNGDLVTAYDNSGTMTFMKWSDASNATSLIEFRTKDIDFGNPGQLKKIYRIYVTYKASGSLTTPMRYLINGGAGAGTAFTGNFATKTNWDVLVATATPFTCQSLQLVFDASSSTKIDINDITILYRPIYRRVS